MCASASLDVQDVEMVMQLFRECRNMLPTIKANLAALQNINHQKNVLEGALRRVEQGRGVGGSVMRVVTATPPLGVLSALPSSTAELLVSQHQEDQAHLIRAVSLAQNTWASRTQRAKSLVEALDTSTISGRPLAKSVVTSSTSAASRKAAAAAAMESLYGSQSSKSIAVPSSVSQCSTNARSERLFRSTGLHSAAALLSAAHSILAVLIKVGSILQECVLALRKDVLMECASSSFCVTHAASLSEVIGREQQAILSTSPPSSELPNSLLLSMRYPQLSLQEALGSLPSFINEQWDKCMAALFTDDAYILLAST